MINALIIMHSGKVGLALFFLFAGWSFGSFQALGFRTCSEAVRSVTTLDGEDILGIEKKLFEGLAPFSSSRTGWKKETALAVREEQELQVQDFLKSPSDFRRTLVRRQVDQWFNKYWNALYELRDYYAMEYLVGNHRIPQIIWNQFRLIVKQHWKKNVEWSEISGNVGREFHNWIKEEVERAFDAAEAMAQKARISLDRLPSDNSSDLYFKQYKKLLTRYLGISSRAKLRFGQLVFDQQPSSSGISPNASIYYFTGRAGYVMERHLRGLIIKDEKNDPEEYENPNALLFSQVHPIVNRRGVWQIRDRALMSALFPACVRWQFESNNLSRGVTRTDTRVHYFWGPNGFERVQSETYGIKPASSYSNIGDFIERSLTFEVMISEE